MTVSSATNKSGPYTGNGVTTVFAYGFRILDASHIKVVRTEGGVDTVLTTGFTVSGVGNAVGGNVTFAVAPTAAQKITLIRNAPFTQQTDLENQGAYYAETIEEAFDLAAMRDQQLQEQIDRSLKVPVGQDASVLDALIEDVIRLVESADNIDTVAKNIADVNAVAGLTAEIAALPGQVLAAETAKAGAEAALDAFDDRYLGAKAIAPTVDNDGNPLLVGAVYWDTVSSQMFTWSGSAWVPTFLTGNSVRSVVTATGGQTVVTVPTYVVGANTLSVYLNGLKVIAGVDYAETNQNTITFLSGLTLGDEVEAIAFQGYPIGTTGAESVQTEYGVTLARLLEMREGTVADLLADTTLAYTGVSAGDVVEAGGYRYQVAASGASDHHVTTAGGVKLYALPRNNVLPMLALSPFANGVTNDAAKITLVNTAGQVVDLGGRDYEFGGVFTATATFINGRIIDDTRTYDYRLVTRETAPTVGQRRGRVNYNTVTSVRVDGIPDRIAMGGFRFMGNYLKSQGRLVPTGLGAASHAVVDMSTQLAGLNTSELDNWYAVFACSNPGSAAVSFRLVPYFRCLSRSGNVITLGHGGENRNASPVAQTYDMAANAFAGVECLVINQGLEFSGRTTTITANTTTTITLADGTGIAALDFLLPAPPGFSEYHYLGTAYWETPGEWRNIADSGAKVNARMVNMDEVGASGALTNAKVRLGGNISPLALGFVGRIVESLSTASTGAVSELISHDGANHGVFQFFLTKEATATVTGVEMIDGLCFSKEQAMWITSGGSLSGSVVSRGILCYGWIEP